jgi:uncharacterized protein (DUF952 family)
VSDQPITYHLTPLDHWLAQRAGTHYEPEPFAREGFIHCTDGKTRVIDVGNRFYASDPRAFCLLSLERVRISARVIYEDPEQVYPHIYGPLNTDAVVDVRRVLRDHDGRFVGIGQTLSDS